MSDSKDMNDLTLDSTQTSVDNATELINAVSIAMEEFMTKDSFKLFGVYAGMNLDLILTKLMELWNKGKVYQVAILIVLVQQMKGGGNMATLKSQKLVGIEKIKTACATLGCVFGPDAKDVGPDVLTPSRVGVALHPVIVKAYLNWKNAKKGADVSYGNMDPLFCSVWGAYCIKDDVKESILVKACHLEWSLKHNSVINKKSGQAFSFAIWMQRIAGSMVTPEDRTHLTNDWCQKLLQNNTFPGNTYGWQGYTVKELTDAGIAGEFFGNFRDAGAGFGFGQASGFSQGPSSGSSFAPSGGFGGNQAPSSQPASKAAGGGFAQSLAALPASSWTNIFASVRGTPIVPSGGTGGGASAAPSSDESKRPGGSGSKKKASGTT